jgi:hypothetical protein
MGTNGCQHTLACVSSYIKCENCISQIKQKLRVSKNLKMYVWSATAVVE